jgi:hypothetical protein
LKSLNKTGKKIRRILFIGPEEEMQGALYAPQITYKLLIQYGANNENNVISCGNRYSHIDRYCDRTCLVG